MTYLKKRDRITHLDGLRGVAILAVIFFHSFHRWSDIVPYQQSQALSVITAPLWLGVELFFAISGFVIFMSLERSRSLLQFATNRWLRLFPAMLIASLLVFATISFFPYRPAGMPNPVDLIPGLVFIRPEILNAITGLEMHSLENVFWSLYVEVIFYAVAAFSYFVLKDRQLFTIVAIYLAYLALLCASLLMPDAGSLLLARKASYAIGFTHYGWFLVGIYSYAWYRDQDEKHFLIAAMLGMLVTVQLFAEEPVGIYAIFMSLLLVCVFLFAIHDPTFARLLSQPSLLYIGAISYPLYLIHENMIVGGAIGLYHQFPYLHPALYPVPFIALAIVLAHFVALLEPLLRSALRPGVTMLNGSAAKTSQGDL